MDKKNTAKVGADYFGLGVEGIQEQGPEFTEEELEEMVREAGAFDPSRLHDINSADTTAIQAYMSGVACYQFLTETEERGLATLVQRGIRSDNLLQSDAQFSEEDRNRLQKNIKQGNTARDKLVTSNLRLVAYAAFKHRHEPSEAATDIMDVIQDGNLGLIHAAEIYDPTKRLRFSTCAMWWIRSAMDAGSRSMKFPCKVTYKTQTKVNAVANAVRDLQESGVQTTTANIAALAGVKEKDVDRLLSVATVVMNTGEFIDSYGNGMECSNEDTMEDEVLNRVCRERILNKMDELLSPTQMLIVTQHFGFVENTPIPLVDIGADLGMSRAATHIAKKRALGRLKNKEMQQIISSAIN